MNWEIYNAVAWAIIVTVHMPFIGYSVAEYFMARRELRKAMERRDKAIRDALESHLAQREE